MNPQIQQALAYLNHCAENGLLDEVDTLQLTVSRRPNPPGQPRRARSDLHMALYTSDSSGGFGESWHWDEQEQFSYVGERTDTIDLNWSPD